MDVEEEIGEAGDYGDEVTGPPQDFEPESISQPPPPKPQPPTTQPEPEQKKEEPQQKKPEKPKGGKPKSKMQTSVECKNMTEEEYKKFEEEFDSLTFGEQSQSTFKCYCGDDGFIAMDGLDQVLRTLGQETSVQELKNIMNEWGDETSGRMDFQQFISMIERQASIIDDNDVLSPRNRQFLEASFKFYDQNKDGSIDTEELVAAFQKTGESVTQSEVEQLFLEADRNADNAINVDEWIILMHAVVETIKYSDDILTYK